MTVFYFHVRDERGLIEDEEGLDLPTIDAALQETLRSAREFVRDTSPPTEMQLEVADAEGRILLKVPLHGRCREAALQG
jgi:hypothetical protein